MRPVPACAHCLQPIADGEHVIHLACSSPTGQLLTVAAAFLRGHPDTPVCHVCLARRLEVTIEEARETANTLRLTGDNYHLLIGGRCGICQRDVAAIELADSRAREPLADAT